MVKNGRDLEREILREHSKRQTVAIARWVGHDATRFGQLMRAFLKGDHRVTQRSAWMVNECVVHRPELARPWLPQMLRKMQEPGIHVAVPRNIMKIFESVELPKNLQGEVVTLCFDYLMNPSAPTAIHAYAMGILLHISREEPDLRNEMRAVIERLVPVGSAGVAARARRVLSRLDRDSATSTGRRPPRTKTT